MIDEIKLNSQGLLFQASTTAKHYMIDAAKEIDAKFGEGFAKANPQLIGDFMKTAAMDFAAAIIAKNIQELCKYIGDLKPDID